MARVGGKELSATWSLSATADSAEITLESRSGKRGTPTERNADYKEALATILGLLGRRGCRLEDVQLSSAKALREAPDGVRRRVTPTDVVYPLDLSKVTDPRDLGRRIQRAMAGMFSERDEPGGGNREKRITLYISSSDRLDDLRTWIEYGAARTDSWLWITDDGEVQDGIQIEMRANDPDNEQALKFLAAISERDRVYHYSIREQAITAASRVVGAANVTLQTVSGVEAAMRPLVGYTRLREHLEMRAPSGGALQPVPPGHAAVLSELLAASAASTASPGNDYREARAPASVRPGAARSTDPALLERALAGHAATQNELARALREAGLRPLSPGIDEPEFDLAWSGGEFMYVAEIKSIRDQNEESQLRLGLGQVLRYRHQLTTMWRRPVRAVIAIERAPCDQTWIAMCAELGVQLVWPAFTAAQFSSGNINVRGAARTSTG
nr:hypothetical protein [Nitrosomonas nitrosa]